MRSIQKITRVQLKINQYDDFVLLGLVSAEPDYKLSLNLNKKFRISLKNISPLKITDDAGSELAFSRFSDTSGSPDLLFNLISNRSGKSFLLKKLKKNALIVADNIFCDEKIFARYVKEHDRNSVEGLKKFIKLIQNKEFFDTKFIDMGDGVSISIYKK